MANIHKLFSSPLKTCIFFMVLLICIHLAGSNLCYAIAPAENPPVYESEPNDNPMEANALSAGRTMAGFLQEGNADHFKFDVPGEQARAYGLILTPARDSDPSIRIEGPAGLIVSIDTAGPGIPESIPWLNLQPGRHLVVVTGRGTNIKEPYTLAVAAVDTPPGVVPETEPNGETTNAQSLPPGAAGYCVCLPGDVDMFTMASPPVPPFIVTIEIGGVTLEGSRKSAGNILVSILDATGGVVKTLGKVNPSKGFGYSFRPPASNAPLPGVSPFIVRVSSVEDFPVAYRLFLSHGPGFPDFETEINDIPRGADRIEAGKVYRAAIFPTGDIDWYELVHPAESGGIYTFIARGPGAACAKLVDLAKGAEKNFPAVRSTGISMETPVFSGATVEFSFEAGPGSRVFIMLGCTVETDEPGPRKDSKSLVLQPGGDYEFFLKYMGQSDPGWESEINDTSSSAKVLADQQRVFGTIDCRGGTDDVDFFHLSAPGEGVFDLRINIDLDPVLSPVQAAVDGAPSGAVGADFPGAVAVSLIGRGERVLETRIFDPSKVIDGKGTMKFYNLLERDYMIRVAPAKGLTGVMGYTIAPKAWELKESKATADYRETVTIYARPGGFRAIAVTSANGSSGSYRMRFCPPDGRGPFFIGEGAIYKDGIFMKFHRFVREGFYVLDSEMPLRVMGIGQDQGFLSVVSGKGGFDDCFPEGVDPAVALLDYAAAFGAPTYHFVTTRSSVISFGSGNFIFLGTGEERGVDIEIKSAAPGPESGSSSILPLAVRCLLRGSAAVDLVQVTPAKNGAKSKAETISVTLMFNEGSEVVSKIPMEGLFLNLVQGETRLSAHGALIGIRRIILNRGSLLVLHPEQRSSPVPATDFLLEGDEEFRAMIRTRDTGGRTR